LQSDTDKLESPKVNGEAAPEASPDERMTMARVVPPERVRVREDEFHVVHLSLDGQDFENVRPVRAFPVSDKADYVSFLDAKGKEVALVAHPHKLDRTSRRAVRAALERMYYIPKIRQVDSIKETWGVSHWEVQTDRGYASFEVVAREQIRKLPRGRYLIQDADGNRYEIESAERLPPRSQALIRSET